MRLATVSFEGRSHVGVIDGELIRLIDSGSDMVSLITAGRNHIENLASQSQQIVPLSKTTLQAPIQRFGRDILCTGWNYWDHFEESRGKREGQDVDRPKAPTFFTKSPYVAAGPNDDIPLDPYISAKWDYEAEIGIVIGCRCRNVPQRAAHEVIFGYFLANDVSQRDLQRRHGGQWLKGKSIDGTMPFGPWIVTQEELDVPEIRLELLLNGNTMQNALVKQMAFSIPELVAELSFGMTLMPGDILITGTPAGIGNAREPQVFLKAGDEMIVRATGLGELRNRVVAKNLHEDTDVSSMSALA
jgi:2,4-diketo-3-deoxy-L-fuconate hydrolase